MEDNEEFEDLGPSVVTIEGEGAYAAGCVEFGDGGGLALHDVRPVRRAVTAYDAMTVGELWQTDRVVECIVIPARRVTSSVSLTFADVLAMAQRGESEPGVATITSCAQHRDPQPDDLLFTDYGTAMVVTSVDREAGELTARFVDPSDTTVMAGDLGRIQQTGATVCVVDVWIENGAQYVTASFGEPRP